MDFGAKDNIAQSLNRRGCEVTVYPAATSAETILASDPDGIMLSERSRRSQRMYCYYKRSEKAV